MLEMSLIVGLGLLVSLAKLPWSWRMRILSSPFLVDCIVFAVLCLLHWGTFSGVMVATGGALMCSLVLSTARKLVGYKEKGKYVPGFYNLQEKGLIA